MSRTPENNPTEGVPSFEQMLDRLSQIVRVLEDGKLGIDESLAIYEEGVRLLRDGRARLTDVQRRVELLTGVDENGVSLTAPFDEPDD
jgi:Exonuclease VII small subunit